MLRSDIFKHFQSLSTIEEKITNLQLLKQFSLPYELDFDGLIKTWSEFGEADEINNAAREADFRILMAA